MITNLLTIESDNCCDEMKVMKQFHFQFAQALKAANCKYATQCTPNLELTKTSWHCKKRVAICQTNILSECLFV